MISARSNPPPPPAHVSLCLSVYLSVSLSSPFLVFFLFVSLYSLINHELTTLYIITVCLLHAYTYVHTYIRVHGSAEDRFFSPLFVSFKTFHPTLMSCFFVTCVLQKKSCFSFLFFFLVSVTFWWSPSLPPSLFSITTVLLMMFDFAP